MNMIVQEKSSSFFFLMNQQMNGKDEDKTSQEMTFCSDTVKLSHKLCVTRTMTK